MTTQNDELGQVLDICLDHVLQDGGSVESCLHRYPHHAIELEPLLRLAVETRQRLGFTPSDAAKATARMALHEAIHRREARQRWQHPWRLLRGFPGRITGPYRWAMGTAAALLLVVLGGTGIVAASSNSLPDQPLYPVKRAVERTRLVLTFDKQAKAQMHAAFANRRVEEMAIMGTKGHNKQVIDLMADLNRHLSQVQRSAFPGVSLPVLELTAVAEPDTTPQAPIRPLVPLGLRPADKRAEQALRQLNTILEKGLQRQDRVLLQAWQDAPEPAKEALRNARTSARQKYQALIQAIQEITDEESAPVRPRDLQRNRR